MSVFTLDLDETERAALEAHRIRLGCRSGAEAIRSLLMFDVPTKTPSQAEFDQQQAQLKAWIAAHPVKPLSQQADVPTLSRPAFNPQPKLKTKGK